MSDAKFTPGPWTAEHDPAWGQWVVFCETMPKHSPILRFSSFDDACQHDAALIAAAPDLYEALRDMCESGGLDDGCDVIAKGLAALKKARGET